MVALEETCLGTLADQERLLNTTVLAESSSRPGRWLFRGDLAVKFAKTTEKEKKPPELKVDQVLLAAEGAKLPFLASYMLSFETLKPLAEVLGDMLTPEGKYFAFCNNIDLSTCYQVPIGPVTFYVFPLDESGVFNELSEMLKVEKGDLKKLSSTAKVDILATTALKYKKNLETISYERGLELMGPVRDPGENRPV